MQISLTDDFVDGLCDIQNRTFLTKDIQEIKKSITDYIGVTLAGKKELEDENRKGIMSIKNTQGVGMIGYGGKFSVKDAALFNGIHAHKIELDDGHRFGMMHPGAPIFSALFPVAEKHNVEGEDFLRGALFGYEVSIRIAMAMQPSLKLKGFHGTGIAGTIGVAVAIGIMLGYDRKTLKNAIDYAATSASGLLGVIDDQSQLKPFNIGNAALQGVLAAEMALIDLQGPEDILGGKRGILKSMCTEIKKEHLDIKIDEEWMIHSIYRKVYAACRHCHPMVEAVINLRNRDNFDIDYVQNISIKTYDLAVEGHDHVIIQGESSAKMSIPYSVAVALKYGHANREVFSGNYLYDPDIETIMKKINIQVDPMLSSWVPQRRAAKIQIMLKNGKIFNELIEYPKGEPENPLSEAELERKFMSLSIFAGLNNGKVKKIMESIKCIETNLNDVITLINQEI